MQAHIENWRSACGNCENSREDPDCASPRPMARLLSDAIERQTLCTVAEREHLADTK
jgi:hypothetical protein